MTTHDPLQVAAERLDPPHLWLDHLQGYRNEVADVADRLGDRETIDSLDRQLATVAALPDDLDDDEAVDEALDRLRGWWHNHAPFHLASLRLLRDSLER